MHPATPSSAARQFAPATARNRDPILDVLKEVLPAGGRVLELASGTGEHAVHFAAAFPGLVWQPTDPNAAARASVAAWIAQTGSANVLPPLALDVRDTPWVLANASATWTSVDAIVCINMIHISPWACTEALFREAERWLATGGVLYLYGPYRREGAHTAPSNAAFDADLRQRDASWGLRDMETVIALAAAHGLQADAAIPMPANNFSLVFRRA